MHSSSSLKGHCHGLWKIFLFYISTFYCPVPPNTRNKFDKKIPQNKIKRVFWGRSRGLQGWKWITIFIFLDGMSRNQNCYPGEILNLLVVIFSQLILLCLHQCKAIKRNDSKLQAILNKIWYISRDNVPLKELRHDILSHYFHSLNYH